MALSSEESSADLPSEFKNVTLASARFFKIASPLEQLDGADPFKKHVLIATSLGHLTELQENQVLRFTKLHRKDVKKILIHHEFNPLQLYIVLLCHCKIACMLSYNDLKILHEWVEISDISSTDSEGTGIPALHLTDTAGDIQTISSVQLSSLSLTTRENHEATERGKLDVAAALAHRLKGGIKHVQQMNSQRRMKETFITQILAAMQSQLQGLNVSEDDTLMPALTVEDPGEDGVKKRVSPLISPNASFKIISVRHKIIHDKWVIGLNVVNNNERMLVCNPQLMLHVSKGTGNLSYNTKILKVVQRRASTNVAETTLEQSKVTIEKLDPPILRPKKKACILGICVIPDFTENTTVVCSGIVTYTCKTLNPESTQQLVPVKVSSRQFQVSFEPVELNAHELHNQHVGIEKSAGQVGVPFSSVALVGGSMYNSVSFTSLVSPLNDLISKLGENFDMIKVPGVSDMYCLYPEKCHPLRFSAMTFLSVSPHNVKLGLYTRDDNQALLLVHSLLAALPSDVCIQPATSSSHMNHHHDDENIRQQLLAKMKEVTTYVMDGYETQAVSCKTNSDQVNVNKSKFLKGNSTGTKIMSTKNIKSEQDFNFDMYNKDREIILASKENVTFSADMYSEWRKKLYKIQFEMDDLYVKYLK